MPKGKGQSVTHHLKWRCLTKNDLPGKKMKARRGDSFGKKETVMGYHLPSSKITAAGILYAVWYLFVPFLILMGILDGLFYLILKYGFGLCYGVFCWLGGTG